MSKGKCVQISVYFEFYIIYLDYLNELIARVFNLKLAQVFLLVICYNLPSFRNQ